MQRTYRAKKDAPGGLDARDVLLSVDDKSSAFDAFFIQSIKQTKREQSCVGLPNKYNASKKVRKRKYVKRIAKELEPVSCDSSIRKSTYLTPDKSFRVNKPQDLFDQLLNTSSANIGENFTKANDLFSQLCADKPKKTYNRKTYRQKVIRKFNCSSDTSSESDKENSVNTHPPQNLTDIRKHEFVIEKDTKRSPISPNDSINKIVNDFSLLKQLRQSGSVSKNVKDKLSVQKNRLTNNLKLPKMQNSPLCSTPFMEKYRSKSIYKFSPIALNLDDSDKDFEQNRDSSVINCNENDMVEENYNFQPNSTVQNDLHSIVQNNINYDSNNGNVPSIDTENDVIEKDNSKRKSESTNSIQDSTENTPFLGFSSQSPGLAKIQNLDKFLRNTSKNSCAEQSPVFKTSRISLRKKNSKEKSMRKSSIKIDKSKKTDESSLVNSVLELSVQIEPFLGFSKCSTAKYILNIEEKSSDNDTAIETTIVESCLPKLRKTSPSINVDSSQDDFNSASENEMGTENESNYDTCSSINSDETPLDKVKVPVVVMKKMNDSLLDKYLKNMPVNDTDSINSSSSGNEDLNDSDSKHTDDSINNSQLAVELIEKVPTDCLVVEKDIDSNTEKSSTDDEVEKHVSFVTTRRRHVAEVDESILMILDESRASSNSSDCDRTVISNNISSPLNDVKEDNFSEKDDLDITAIRRRRQIENKDVILDNKRPKSTRNTVAEKVFDKHNTSQTDDVAPIVLQPGKRWERSLSIYKRMTMMDETLLEDTDLKNKGRKYRQSVISTMEMQDRGPLHNESVCSRRNTTVQRHRSSILLYKESNSSRLSLHTTTEDYDDLTGFLSDDCDDTLVELSKLSIADEHEITVLGKVDDPPEQQVAARDYVLRRCGQTDAVPFDECYPETLLKNCHKIGEGVYGEVYLYRARDGVRVMKIVPIAGDTVVNGEQQKDFNEIISEIVIAMELSALRAPIPDVEKDLEDATPTDLHAIGNATDVFNEVLEVRCVKGPYPSRLLDLWELYDECKGSENDNPTTLPSDQQFIVLELANAGHDLESFQFANAEQAYAVFLQVAYGLAVAEEAYQFEHRDLHWGNVLIAPTEQKYATFVLRGRSHLVPRRGAAATVIDYSLSRLALPVAGDRAALYADLAHDDTLFAAAGDRQFDVYRLMRERLGNDWKSYDPYTNVLWLHYTADKMVTVLRYRRTQAKVHKHYIAKIKAIKNRLLEYSSATHFVLTDQF